MISHPSELAGWTPLRVDVLPSTPTVDWCRLGQLRFTDPFFQQTIERALRNPAALLFQRETPIEVLETIKSDFSSLRPSGFIFHLSRCGSTLLAQMLAALPRSIVISEAPPIDQILTCQLRRPDIPFEKRVAWLRGLIAALAQKRFDEEQHCFIKFDCWHIFELPLIRAAFPDVPWIFLYRDPLEVMVSHRKLRGTQMIPGIVDSRIFGLEPATAKTLPIDGYGARVLGRICAAGLAHAKRYGGRLLNFNQLPGAFWTTLAPGFGLEFTDADHALLHQAATANAKNPVLPFQDDTEAKQRAASAELRRLVDDEIGGTYATLEAWRASQETSAGANPGRFARLDSTESGDVLGVPQQQFA